MTVTDLLALRVTLDGTERVMRGLSDLANQTAKVSKETNAAAAAGAAYVAAGLGLGYTSLQAAESVGRLRVQLQALYDRETGAGLTDQLRALSGQTIQGFEELAAAARKLANSGVKAEDLVPTVAEIANLSALGANMEGAARALGQMKSSGFIYGEELNQLIDADFVMGKIMEKMGKTRREIMGGKVSSEEFFAAMRAVNQEMGDLGGKMKGELPLTALGKAMDKLRDSLAPTGRLIGQILTPAIALVGALTNAFSWLNNVTGGFAGLAVIVGLTSSGIVKMLGLLRLVAQIQSVQMVVGWMRQAAAVQTLLGWLGKLRLMEMALRAIQITRLFIQTAIAAVSANPLAAVGVAALAALGVGFGVHAFNSRGGGDGGGRSTAPAASAPVAERPIRRSSWENVYARSFRAQAGAY